MTTPVLLEPLEGLVLAHRPWLFDQLVIKDVVIGNVYRLPLDLEGATVVDLGAHIGSFSALCVYRGAELVRAFEPEPANLELLRRNVAPFGRHVELYPCAVGREAGYVHVVGESWAAHVGEDGHRVGQASLEGVLSLGPVDVLKVDIEGGESALVGCDLSAVGYVVVETHGPAEKPWVRAPVVGALVEQLLYTHDVEVTGSPAALGLVFARRR